MYPVLVEKMRPELVEWGNGDQIVDMDMYIYISMDVYTYVLNLHVCMYT